MAEAKKRFREVNFSLFISSLSCNIIVGLSNCNESKLFSMAGDPINELLFHPDTTPVNQKNYPIMCLFTAFV